MTVLVHAWFRAVDFLLEQDRNNSSWILHDLVIDCCTYKWTVRDMFCSLLSDGCSCRQLSFLEHFFPHNMTSKLVFCLFAWLIPQTPSLLFIISFKACCLVSKVTPIVQHAFISEECISRLDWWILEVFGALNLYNACVEWWRMSLLCADHHFHFASHPPRCVYVSPYILHLKRPSHSSQTQKESVICLPYLPAWCLCVSVCVVLFLVCMCVCLILYWFYYTMLCHYCHWHIWHKIYFSLIFLCLNSFICLTILLLYLFFSLIYLC